MEDVGLDTMATDIHRAGGGGWGGAIFILIIIIQFNLREVKEAEGEAAVSSSVMTLH